MSDPAALFHRLSMLLEGRREMADRAEGLFDGHSEMTDSPRRIAILAIPGVQMLDLAGPMDVFSEANSLIRGPSAYAITIVALSSGPLTALNGARILPDVTIES